MLCDDCGKNPATIKFTQIVNDRKTVLHLCRKCAEKRGLKDAISNISFSLGDLFAGMTKKEPEKAEGKGIEMLCPGCGHSFAEFEKSGKLGCGACYEFFSLQLKDLLRRIHGSNQHVGKSPPQLTLKMELKREVRRLRDDLRKAVESEEFEKAAELRDRIKDLSKSS